MKTFTSLLLTCCCACALAQTNTAPVAPESPALPRAESQASPPAEPEKPGATLATNDRVRLKLDLPLPNEGRSLLDDFAALAAEEEHAPTTANSEQALMQRYHERLSNAGYLHPTPAPQDDLFSRTVNTMFQPEPIRMGRASVAFSPITAIKRRNPLALLNPIVLNISW